MKVAALLSIKLNSQHVLEENSIQIALKELTDSAFDIPGKIRCLNKGRWHTSFRLEAAA